MTVSVSAQANKSEMGNETLEKNYKILLALTGVQLNRNAFKYALNMCKHTGAELEILYVSKHADVTLKQFQSELKKHGIGYRYIKRYGCLVKEIQNYTDMKEDILYVVMEIPEELTINNKKTVPIIAKPLKKLRCPLVVVSKDKISPIA
ncbi:MAG: hypothetical protein GTN59_08465 [Candidatus Dadabacteria bacterium]|nr:hypothetical protein [Candidatus Dadabacteria bacterium]